MNCCNDYGKCSCTGLPSSSQPKLCNAPEAEATEDADKAAWIRLLRETFILLAGICIGALVAIAAAAAGARTGIL